MACGWVCLQHVPAVQGTAANAEEMRRPSPALRMGRRVPDGQPSRSPPRPTQQRRPVVTAHLRRRPRWAASSLNPSARASATRRRSPPAAAGQKRVSGGWAVWQSQMHPACRSRRSWPCTAPAAPSPSPLRPAPHPPDSWRMLRGRISRLPGCRTRMVCGGAAAAGRGRAHTWSYAWRPRRSRSGWLCARRRLQNSAPFSATKQQPREPNLFNLLDGAALRRAFGLGRRLAGAQREHHAAGQGAAARGRGARTQLGCGCHGRGKQQRRCSSNGLPPAP